jgi:hypothetical protein
MTSGSPKRSITAARMRPSRLVGWEVGGFFEVVDRLVALDHTAEPTGG